MEKAIPKYHEGAMQLFQVEDEIMFPNVITVTPGKRFFQASLPSNHQGNFKLNCFSLEF